MHAPSPSTLLNRLPLAECRLLKGRNNTEAEPTKKRGNCNAGDSALLQHIRTAIAKWQGQHNAPLMLLANKAVATKELATALYRFSRR